MLLREEAIRIAEQFGVADQQVEKDYLISLVLAVISREFARDVIFFGGTALARTHLTSGSLSEDLDLIAIRDRMATAAQLDKTLPRALLREFGRLERAPP